MTKASSTMAREAGTSQPVFRPVRRRLSASHFLIAIVVVLAFLLNLFALQQRDATTLVAVAEGALNVGTPISPNNLRMVSVPTDLEGLESLVEQSDLVGLDGWVLASPVADGGLIQSAALVEPGSPDGLRTMGLPLPVEHAAGGTLNPGDRIDVIAVKDGAARFVVADVEVVAVSDATSGFGGAGDYYLVVAVDSEQALALAAALDSGAMEVIRSTGAPGVEVINGGS